MRNRISKRLKKKQKTLKNSEKVKHKLDFNIKIMIEEQITTMQQQHKS